MHIRVYIYKIRGNVRTRSAQCNFLLKNLKYFTTSILYRLVFKIHVTGKFRKLSNNQTMGTS